MKPTLKVAVVTGTSVAPGAADKEYKSADLYPEGSRHNWTRSNAIVCHKAYILTTRAVLVEIVTAVSPRLVSECPYFMFWKLI